MTETQAALTAAEGQVALQLARRSLESWLVHHRKLELEAPPTGGLALPCGAFVTVHGSDGELRGCIGHMVSDGPLAELVIELGIAAGTGDPRFAPVTAAELPELSFEISVLTPMRRIKAEDVTPGVHGLYIRRGRNSGVLLPQVAIEWGWDREQFLAHTCNKAGLLEDAWREPGTEILAFTAQIFSE